MASGRNVQSKALCNSACSVVTLFCWAHSSWTVRSDGECCLRRELKRPSGLGQAIELLIRIVEVHSSNTSRTTSFDLCHSLFTIIQAFDNIPHYLPKGSLIKCIARSEPDGTRWRMGGEVKGKDANGVGSQQPRIGRRSTVYTIAVRWSALLDFRQSNELTPPPI